MKDILKIACGILLASAAKCGIGFIATKVAANKLSEAFTEEENSEQ